jgi:hypothetical protein
MSDANHKPNFAIGFVAAAAGGVIGYFVFFWMARQGFYTLIIPPALLGLAGGLAIRSRSQLFGILCGIAGLASALFIEWRFELKFADKSFAYFLAHLHECKPLTLIMLLIGTVISYRLALGMERRSGNS